MAAVTNNSEAQQFASELPIDGGRAKRRKRNKTKKMKRTKQLKSRKRNTLPV
jgi:hypothetical protein